MHYVQQYTHHSALKLIKEHALGMHSRIRQSLCAATTCTKGLCTNVQAAIGCCILLILMPKIVLTFCNLHWWCFSCHEIVQRPHLYLQCALPDLKQLLYKVQTKWNEYEARRTYLRWVNLINRDLQEILNWQVAADRDAWWAIHAPTQSTPNPNLWQSRETACWPSSIWARCKERRRYARSTPMPLLPQQQKFAALLLAIS